MKTTLCAYASTLGVSYGDIELILRALKDGYEDSIFTKALAGEYLVDPLKVLEESTNPSVLPLVVTIAQEIRDDGIVEPLVYYGVVAELEKRDPPAHYLRCINRAWQTAEATYKASLFRIKPCAE